MAVAAKKSKKSLVAETQLKLLYGEDSITKYWSSSLFNTVYLRHDISEKHSLWNSEDDLNFQNFLNSLKNLAIEYKNQDKELSQWSETETINNWVKHVLHALGWTNNCNGVQNPFLEETSFRFDGKTYRTDILIVDHPKEKQYINQSKGDDKLIEARQAVIMPVEVKYWNRLEEYRQGKLEEKKKNDAESDDISKLTTPNEQTVQYMRILKKNWGILTDGSRWRLFNSDLSSEDAERFYEFNLNSLYNAICTEETEADSREVIEASKYFYHFFSKFAFYPTSGEEPFVDEVLNYSRKYVNKVEEDLKDRFVKAMNIACNGFYKKYKKSLKDENLSVIRNVAESALFNLLFLKSLESRSILPMSSTDYKKISLTSIVDKIEKYDPEKDELLNRRELERAFKKGNGNSFSYKDDGNELHERIVRLTSVIHKGASKAENYGFEIVGFKESIFNDQEWNFFKNCSLSNSEWVGIIFELGYAESESMTRKYQQIPYAYFTPRQLGSIYESFLEFKLDIAKQDMVFVKKQWKPMSLNTPKVRIMDVPKVAKGDLFFTPDNEDRKATGSYYTPDFIVQFMVKQTLGPIVENKKSEEILNIKICDPAMGSGHFLVASLNYIQKSFLSASMNEPKSREVSLTELKGKVLENCIFGLDLNPRAVKLAKMSLWLESANINAKLNDLDENIINRNTLLTLEENEVIKNKKALIDEGHVPFSIKTDFGGRVEKGFDAVVGNPPYNASNASLVEGIVEQIYGNEGNSNTANLFIVKSKQIVNVEGRVGLIIPKSYYYSSTWESARNRDINQLESTVDVSEAFPDVLLEQVIIILSKNKSKEVKTFSVDKYEIIEEGTINREVFKELGIIVSGCGKSAYSIYDSVKDKSISTADVLRLKRGFLLQKSLGDGSGKVYRGKNIQKFHKTKSEDRIDESILRSIRQDNSWLKDTLGLAQNIVAHVTKPKNQIVLMASQYDNEIGLDNLSYILPTSDWIKKYPNAVITYFNSWFISWYMYRFCYSKAVRTMRFDNCHLEKMPFPKVFKLNEKADCKLGKKDTDFVIKVSKQFKGKIDDNFFEAGDKLISTISPIEVLELIGREVSGKSGSEGLLALSEVVIIKSFGLDKFLKDLSAEYDLRAYSGLPDGLASTSPKKGRLAS